MEKKKGVIYMRVGNKSQLNMEEQKELVRERTSEEIISKEDFEKAQKILKEKSE